jgi:hypothetical protein
MELCEAPSLCLALRAGLRRPKSFPTILCQAPSLCLALRAGGRRPKSFPTILSCVLPPRDFVGHAYCSVGLLPPRPAGAAVQKKYAAWCSFREGVTGLRQAAFGLLVSVRANVFATPVPGVAQPSLYGKTITYARLN